MEGMMAPEREARRLYGMMKAQIKAFHEKKHLHQSTIAVCREAIDLAERAAPDAHFWIDVKILISNMKDPEEKQ